MNGPTTCDCASPLGRRAAMLALGCLCLAGCGRMPEMALVEGRVLHRGEPLEFGTVMFQPEHGGQPAQGKIGVDGAFRIATAGLGEGVPVGRCQVRVTAYSSDADGAAAVSDTEFSLGKLLIPRRYANFSTSGLTAEVKSGEINRFTFELTD